MRTRHASIAGVADADADAGSAERVDARRTSRGRCAWSGVVRERP
jgi:hypothetical protein